MSVCDGCKKQRYCKKECRPAREERQLALRRDIVRQMAARGLIAPYSAGLAGCKGLGGGGVAQVDD